MSAERNLTEMNVTSTSIDENGKLMMECAADQSPNLPRGKNRSPQLHWTAVDGAACYAVCMFDEDANWLHWLVTDIRKTSLELGEYTKKSYYVGPYPPPFAGRHRYRIDVFALNKEPIMNGVKMDAVNPYPTIVDRLNIENEKPDNILAKGTVVGTFAHGDTTK